MDSIIQAQLDRIETALTTLVDSISSYNPSITAANSLLEADVKLQDGLQKLQTHAHNTARITSLRNTISRQNDLITSDLKLLTQTRTDLLSIPSTSAALSSPHLSSQGESRLRDGVTYADLLTYAKHIARFTSPPVGAFRSRPGATTEAIDVGSTSGAGGQAPTDAGAGAGTGTDVSGTNTKAKATPTEKTAPDTSTLVSPTHAAQRDGRGISDLSQMEKQWLDPWTGVLVTPWPGEDVLKRGALAELQAIVESGGSVEADGKVVTGDDEQLMDGGAGEGAMEVDGGAGPDVDVSKGVRGGPEGLENGHVGKIVEKREEKPKVFGGLDLYDPDEEG